MVVPTQSPLFVKYKHIHVSLFAVPKAHFFSRLVERTVKEKKLAVPLKVVGGSVEQIDQESQKF